MSPPHLVGTRLVQRLISTSRLTWQVPATLSHPRHPSPNPESSFYVTHGSRPPGSPRQCQVSKFVRLSATWHGRHVSTFGCFHYSSKASLTFLSLPQPPVRAGSSSLPRGITMPTSALSKQAGRGEIYVDHTSSTFHNTLHVSNRFTTWQHCPHAYVYALEFQTG